MNPHPYQNLHSYPLTSSKNIWPKISVAYFTKWFQPSCTVGGFCFFLELDFKYPQLFVLKVGLDWVLKIQDWIWIGKYDSPFISAKQSPGKPRKWSRPRVGTSSYPAKCVHLRLPRILFQQIYVRQQCCAVLLRFHLQSIGRKIIKDNAVFSHKRYTKRKSNRRFQAISDKLPKRFSEGKPSLTNKLTKQNTRACWNSFCHRVGADFKWTKRKVCQGFVAQKTSPIKKMSKPRWITLYIRTSIALCSIINWFSFQVILTPLALWMSDWLNFILSIVFGQNRFLRCGVRNQTSVDSQLCAVYGHFILRFMFWNWKFFSHAKIGYQVYP